MHAAPMFSLSAPTPLRGIAPWVRLVREKGPTPYPEKIAVRPSCRSPREVWALCRDMEHLETEAFVVLCLDASHAVVARVEVSRGILNSSLVHPREVFRVAIAIGACSVVLVHNHPSGEVTPSSDDRAITSQLVAAGRLLDIPVHDHVIIGANRFTSFAEAGLL